jgi:hypothetical protein
MTRIFSVLAVTALMVAMLVASAMPAFAAPNCEGFKDGPTKKLNGQHRAHNNAADRGDVDQDLKHSDKEGACLGDVPPGEAQ